MYDKIVENLELVESKTYLTVTGFQKYLKLGYAICARLIERLETDGYISRWHQEQPRVILKTK